MKKQITIKDVAKAAGVSHPVVSAILSGNRSTVRFSEATKARVLKVADEMKYKPNILARSFQQKKSFLIGVLGFDVNSWIFADMLEGIQSETFSRNYAPIFLTHSTPEEEEANLQICLDRMVDGLIVNATLDPNGVCNVARYKELMDDDMPIVEFFGKGIEGAPTVIPANYEIGRNAVKHLIEKGHKNIALVTHDRYKSTSRNHGLNWDAWDQYRGYEDAMEDAGLKSIVITHPMISEPSVNSGWRKGGEMTAEKIVNHKRDITAVICYIDYEAYGVIRGLQRLGKSVPNDIAVMSNRAVGIGDVIEPNLTTQKINVKEIGRTAAEMVFDLLGEVSVETKRLTNELVVRKSTEG
jgi:LacI family transcriptional regulator